MIPFSEKDNTNSNNNKSTNIEFDEFSYELQNSNNKYKDYSDTKFYCKGTLEVPIVLNIKDFGYVSFPFITDQIKSLNKYSDIKEKKEKLFQFSPDCFNIGGKTWDLTISYIIENIKNELGLFNYCQTNDEINVELYRLFIYENGGCYLPTNKEFKSNRDNIKNTSKSGNGSHIFGTLLIILPGKESNGDLIELIGSTGEIKLLSIDKYKNPSEIRYIAFYSDCTYEIKIGNKNKESYKLFIVYNLIFTTPQPPPQQQKQQQKDNNINIPSSNLLELNRINNNNNLNNLSKTLNSLLNSNNNNNNNNNSDNGIKYVWVLNNYYIQINQLDNNDLTIYEILESLSKRLNLCLYFADLQIEEHSSNLSNTSNSTYILSKFIENDQSSSSTTLNLESIKMNCSIGELMPLECLNGNHRFSRKKTNKGETIKVYHKSVIVFFKRDEFKQIINNHFVDKEKSVGFISILNEREEIERKQEQELKKQKLEEQQKLKEQQERELKEQQEKRLKEQKERELKEQKEQRLKEQKERELKEQQERELKEQQEQRLKEQKLKEQQRLKEQQKFKKQKERELNEHQKLKEQQEKELKEQQEQELKEQRELKEKREQELKEQQRASTKSINDGVFGIEFLNMISDISVGTIQITKINSDLSKLKFDDGHQGIFIKLLNEKLIPFSSSNEDLDIDQFIQLSQHIFIFDNDGILCDNQITQSNHWKLLIKYSNKFLKLLELKLKKPIQLKKSMENQFIQIYVNVPNESLKDQFVNNYLQSVLDMKSDFSESHIKLFKFWQFLISVGFIEFNGKDLSGSLQIKLANFIIGNKGINFQIVTSLIRCFNFHVNQTLFHDNPNLNQESFKLLVVFLVNSTESINSYSPNAMKSSNRKLASQSMKPISICFCQKEKTKLDSIITTNTTITKTTTTTNTSTKLNCSFCNELNQFLESKEKSIIQIQLNSTVRVNHAESLLLEEERFSSVFNYKMQEDQDNVAFLVIEKKPISPLKYIVISDYNLFFENTRHLYTISQISNLSHIFRPLYPVFKLAIQTKKRTIRNLELPLFNKILK